MILDITNNIVFGFQGPNLCLLGNESDFKKLAESIVDLTDIEKSRSFELTSQVFIRNEGIKIPVMFFSEKGANVLCEIHPENLIFRLDPRFWERIFKYFVLMSWNKRTYYLNADEDCLEDFDLEQNCNFICSSEFG